MIMRKFLFAGAVLLAATVSASAQNWQWRAETDPFGETRFYDQRGRYQGRAQADPFGETRFYDRRERYWGRTETDPFGGTRFYGENPGLGLGDNDLAIR